MPEMAVAAGAQDLGADHAVAEILHLGRVKLGQPQPDLNLVSEANNGWPQPG
jgi:hypothetical protein